MSKKKLFYSSTAEMTCLFRAQSFGEQRKQFKGDDFIAVMICSALNSFLSMMHKSFPPGSDIFNSLAPPGAYEYISARTNFLDNLFRTLPMECRQVFILGAGFDSRACRFQQQLKNCQVYECDHPDMQQTKLAIFKKIDIDFPDNVHFVAVDFSRQSLSDAFAQHDIPRGENCFFVLEGLTYYLDPPRVADIFAAISAHGCPGSQVFFDFPDAGVITGENDNHDSQACAEEVKKLGEIWKFGIAPGMAAQFLGKFNFDIIELLTSDEMEQRYFTDENHHRLAKVMSSLTLALAQRARTGSTPGHGR
ncbi:class I SAM-dependent methyltransferase [Acerihabitans arboris]|uniref:S-adenosyl-L-methionine-dependent methyltransferase n=1 Tax=Acerihabitans arboris TaxID=2691583 RepID=A0A845SJY6_9GAMM|nr:SAM-dependent methyltransferase [Acerihabitans arboris]NDL65230.1 SAM-dependent methyltransferase [Acerihabitans arboris]